MYANRLRAATLIDKPVRRQTTPAAAPDYTLAIEKMCCVAGNGFGTLCLHRIGKMCCVAGNGFGTLCLHRIEKMY